MNLVRALSSLIVLISTFSCLPLDDGTCRSIGGNNGDDGCKVSALCDSDGNGSVVSGVDESFDYTCDAAGTCTCANEAQTQFSEGCPGTDATHFLLLKKECGFDVVLNSSFCQELGGTADECDDLVK